MRSLARPLVGVSAVLDLSGVSGRITSVLRYRDELVAAEAEYEFLLKIAGAYVVPRRVEGVPDDVQTSVAWAYKSKLVNGSARDVYDMVQASAGGRCPLCLVRQTQALDHYLPKESFPGYAIQPSNLVPICGTCNQTKAAGVATNADDQFLHPYFDLLGEDDWLRAEVLEQDYAPLRYFVEAPDDWTPRFMNRVSRHFNRFGLADLFAGEAAAMLSSISYRLSRAAPQVRRELLEDEAESYRHGGKQPWLTAALRAWATSDWFCDGGWIPTP